MNSNNFDNGRQTQGNNLISLPKMDASSLNQLVSLPKAVDHPPNDITDRSPEVMLNDSMDLSQHLFDNSLNTLIKPNKFRNNNAETIKAPIEHSLGIFGSLNAPAGGPPPAKFNIDRINVSLEIDGGSPTMFKN